ncbi:hypothetical protein EC988_010279, partial [Linderina pennispora]
DGPSDPYIIYDHKCACTVNMAPASTNGLGVLWFKTFDYGCNTTINKWCTNLIHEGGGKVDLTIPANIKDGDYIVRGEFRCPTLKGNTDSSVEPKGYDIIKAYQASNESKHVACNKNFTSYPIPGPAVY